MTGAPARTFAHPRRLAAAVALAVVLGAVLGWSGPGRAQGPTTPGAAKPAGKAAPEQGTRWRDLSPAQQNVLRPLEREWSGIGTAHKDKWIELSSGFSKRSPADQARIQERMGEWARMTTQQRSQARLNFQEAKQLNPQDRKARWDAYQALPPERRQQLAERAAPSAQRPPPRSAAAGGDAQVKSNIVPNSAALAASPKVVAPTVVQARPGATTTSITRRPAPPSHQQTGLPKIAATPEFVDKATLLPQRGPQGAATRVAPPPGPAATKK